MTARAALAPMLAPMLAPLLAPTLALALASMPAAPAAAAPSAYDFAFVGAFEAACVPQRLSYPGTVETARAGGWSEVSRAAHPELDALMARAEAAEKDPELKPTFTYTLMSRPLEGVEHFLVVTRSTFVVGEEDDLLNPWVLIGCYLYNLDATGPIDPAPVSALTGKPVASSHSDERLTSHVWGPPCPMPRTGDTYLAFVPEGSPHADETGFSGLVLKFATSEPKPGEDVPETYC